MVIDEQLESIFMESCASCSRETAYFLEVRMCHEGMSSHWRRKHNFNECVLVVGGREEAKGSFC